MAIKVQEMTAEKLLRMPKDGFRYELIKGELRKMSPAGSEHGKLVMRLAASLFRHVEANNLGVVYAAETGFKLSTNPDTVRAPDVAFVSRGRVEEAGKVEGYWPGAPDLAVEVTSPNDTYAEVEDKVLDWLSAGARVVIVINSRKHTVAVYRSLTDIVILTENDTIDGGNAVPGWTMPVGDLFK
jgi:Uncharacterized protein conserved in cyanobacteria